MHKWNENYNFKIGHPPDETSQIESFKKAIDHTFKRFENPDSFSSKDYTYTYRFLNYGDKRGDIGVREAISKWVTEDTYYKVYADNLFITNGCSHALDILCCAFLKNGDNILVEAPTYYIMLNTFKDHRLNPISIMKNEDDGTLNIERVEYLIKEHNIKAFYVIATCHNPTNLNIPIEQRNDLYNLALKYKCYMFVDDVYERFYYNNTETNRLTPTFYCSNDIVNNKVKKQKLHRKEIIDYDPNSNPYVISMCSFNKLINPGFRIGWIMAEKNVINRLEAVGYVASGGSVNNTISQFVRSYIELGLIEEAIEYTKQNFNKRIELCDKVLKGSKAFTYIKPQGGYFYWLRLNNKVNINKLKKKLDDENTVILFGDSAADLNTLNDKEKEQLSRRIRLCFTRYEMDKMVKGFEFVRKLIEDCFENNL